MLLRYAGLVRMEAQRLMSFGELPLIKVTADLIKQDADRAEVLAARIFCNGNKGKADAVS